MFNIVVQKLKVSEIKTETVIFKDLSKKEFADKITELPTLHGKFIESMEIFKDFRSHSVVIDSIPQTNTIFIIVWWETYEAFNPTCIITGKLGTIEVKIIEDRKARIAYVNMELAKQQEIKEGDYLSQEEINLLKEEYNPSKWEENEDEEMEFIL